MWKMCNAYGLAHLSPFDDTSRRMDSGDFIFFESSAVRVDVRIRSLRRNGSSESIFGIQAVAVKLKCDNLTENDILLEFYNLYQANGTFGPGAVMYYNRFKTDPSNLATLVSGCNVLCSSFFNASSSSVEIATTDEMRLKIGFYDDFYTVVLSSNIRFFYDDIQGDPFLCHRGNATRLNCSTSNFKLGGRTPEMGVEETCTDIFNIS
jgi:ASC-1-like (ASCH) protein